MGWWAKRGRVPLGYLDDEAKSRKTFVTIDGERYAVPGDRARHLADGTMELHGRDSVTINSGGEKIFAEEVEHASSSTRRCTTRWWPGGPASAGAARWWPWCGCATACRSASRR
jgi:acyl-CoA synthetase (AMP-forming)/AMP-acid ligase II